MNIEAVRNKRRRDHHLRLIGLFRNGMRLDVYSFSKTASLISSRSGAPGRYFRAIPVAVECAELLFVVNIPCNRTKIASTYLLKAWVRL